MPAEIVRRINAVCQAALAEAAVAERVGELGLVSLGDMTPEAMLDFVRREGARWAPIVRAAGITG